MSDSPANSSASPRRRWFGPAASIALAILIIGRILLEPLRTQPHFDDETMEGYAAVESFQIKRNLQPIETGIFGSSVVVWGVIPELVAGEMQADPRRVRKLAMQGGTAFDMWNLVERHQGEFGHMHTALLQVDPRMFDKDKEGGRLDLAVAQHGTWEERMLLDDRMDRWTQLAEVAVPLRSARHSLRSVFLDALNPSPGNPVFPTPELRLVPDWQQWRERDDREFKPKMSAQNAARIMFNRWVPSRLHDDSMRRLILWLRARHVRTFLFQVPVHPSLLETVAANPAFAEGLETWNRHMVDLGVPEQDIIRVGAMTDIGILESGMKDHTHLNEAGAKIFSRWLGAQVRERLAKDAAQSH